jgi:hypothetical protein
MALQLMASSTQIQIDELKSFACTADDAMHSITAWQYRQ